jgi:hypothetical protein
MSRRPPPALKRHVGAREDPLRRQPDEAVVDLLVAASVLLGALGADVARGDPGRPDAQVVGPTATSALPRTVTKACGKASSSTATAARGSRARLRAFTDDPAHVNTIWSPSRTNHTGTTSGAPSARVVASLAVRMPAARNARASSGLIVRIATTLPPARSPGRLEPGHPTRRVAFTASARRPPSSTERATPVRLRGHFARAKQASSCVRRRLPALVRCASDRLLCGGASLDGDAPLCSWVDGGFWSSTGRSVPPRSAHGRNAGTRPLLLR